MTEYKPKGKARMAICRKVFTKMFQMLKKGEYHQFRDRENHAKKLKAYFRFLEKNGIQWQNIGKGA